LAAEVSSKVRRPRHALRHAALQEASCATLFSEDLLDGQVIDRPLTIRNRFSHTRITAPTSLALCRVAIQAR
jgi:hypothetical protein